MSLLFEILLVVFAVWLIVNTAATCVTLWLVWKREKPRINLRGVRKNKVTEEALRSLDD
jgi:hypothetical protein